MSTFYLWVTVPSPAIEAELVSKLIHGGYTVSALCSDGTTTHWDNALCSIFAFKLIKDVQAIETKRPPSVVRDEVERIFKVMNATLLAIIVSVEADSAWNIGTIPTVPDDKSTISPLLKEDPFG